MLDKCFQSRRDILFNHFRNSDFNFRPPTLVINILLRKYFFDQPTLPDRASPILYNLVNFTLCFYFVSVARLNYVIYIGTQSVQELRNDKDRRERNDKDQFERAPTTFAPAAMKTATQESGF